MAPYGAVHLVGAQRKSVRSVASRCYEEKTVNVVTKMAFVKAAYAGRIGRIPTIDAWGDDKTLIVPAFVVEFSCLQDRLSRPGRGVRGSARAA